MTRQRLPPEFLDLADLTGRPEITPEESQRHHVRPQRATAPIVPLTASEVLKAVQRGAFPAPIRVLGTTAIAWCEREVLDWLSRHPQS